jgi:hypothetical protein
MHGQNERIKLKLDLNEPFSSPEHDSFKGDELDL